MAPISVAAIANAGQTGGPAVLGDTQLSDVSIDSAEIDNGNYAYYFLCKVIGTDSTVGLFGATADYTLTGELGAAA